MIYSVYVKVFLLYKWIVGDIGYLKKWKDLITGMTTEMITGVIAIMSYIITWQSCVM